MKYKIVYLQESSFVLIEKLAREVNLPEKVDYDCEFIGAVNNDCELMGVVGVNFIKYQLPRFEHIIIALKYQKSRIGICLMAKIEEMIKLRNFTEYLAFILNENYLMQNYARRFGFKELEKKEKGTWFIKKIEARRREYAYA